MLDKENLKIQMNNAIEWIRDYVEKVRSKRCRCTEIVEERIQQQ